MEDGNESCWNCTLVDGFQRANSLMKNETRSFIENTVLASVIFILALVAVVGNFLVIVLALVDRDLRRQVSNIIIGNLAVVDAATALLVMVPSGIAVLFDSWPFSDLLCDIHGGISYIVVSATQFSICLLSLDRLISVKRPLHYPSLVTHRRTFLALVPIWLLSITFGGRPMMGQWIVYDYWEISCNNNWYQLANDSFVNTAFGAAFVGPCVLILGANIYIVYVAHYSSSLVVGQRPERKIPDSPFTIGNTESRRNRSQSSNELSVRNEDSALTRGSHGRPSTVRRIRVRKAPYPTTKRILYSILTVTVCFFICLTPYTIVKLLKLWTKNPDLVPNKIAVFSTMLHFVNSCINPFIYGILRRDYRRAYYRLRKKLC